MIRYAAYGDHIYCSPIIGPLSEKYDIYFETSMKGYQLFHDDPRITKLSVFEIEKYTMDQYERAFEERWKLVREDVKPDLEINLNGTLEFTCVGESWQLQSHLPYPERRAYFGIHAFYDAVFERAGVKPEPLNLEGLYFPPEAYKAAEEWRSKKPEAFVVMLSPIGSTAQKVIYNHAEVALGVVERWGEAQVFYLGDELTAKFVPAHPRIKSLCAIPVKQAILWTKYADFVVGPETGLLAAAGMWGTPKCILSTTSSVYQMTKYTRNDFSVQSPLACSPCHRAIYTADDCADMRGNLASKTMYPACSKSFPTDLILERIGRGYELFRANLQSKLPG